MTSNCVLAFSLHNLGHQRPLLGEAATAERCFGDALAHYRASCDAWGMGLVLDTLADLAQDRGDLRQAMAGLEEALRGFNRLATAS